MELFGQMLPSVRLRFGSASRFATDASPRNGIRRFGPYDANLFTLDDIVCGLIYPTRFAAQRDALVRALVDGDGPNFPGFTPWFRACLRFDMAVERGVAHERDLRQAANDVAARGCDLVFIIVGQRSEQAYRECKAILLSNGIPCQFVIASKLENSGQRPWIVGNMALAAYAKVGGTPWVVADPSGASELVMGVSRARDETGRYVVGFVTLFNQDGDFLFLHAKTPVVYWEEYVAGLEEMVVDAYREYERDFGAPQALTIHFHKRPGHQEVEAVERALSSFHQTIPYALLHVNEFSAFRLFDTGHSTYVPRSGLQVDLSRRRSLLLLDGRENDRRNRMGVPNVWDISLDNRSTVPLDRFPRLVGQVHRFAHVNWRGFNARSLPVTINYSKLICDQVLEVGLSLWNSIVANGRLRDKAWFL